MTPTLSFLNMLEAARLRVELLWPYLSSGLRQLRGPIWVEGVAGGPIGVDARWRLYADPGELSKWTVPQLETVLRHELWHCLRDHASRRGSDHDPKTWNVAADHEVDSDLEAEQPGPHWPPVHHLLPGPDRGDGSLRTGLALGLLAEKYYDLLAQQEDPNPTLDRDQDQAAVLEHPDGSGAGKGSTPPGDHAPSRAPGGSCADGIQREWELAAGPPGPSDSEQEIARRAVAEAIRIAANSKQCGSTAGGMQRWADSVLAPPVVNWQVVLRRAVQGGISARGASDYTYRRLSRRDPAGNRGYLSPGLHSPRPEVAVIVDTSGSVSDLDLAQAVAEVVGCARAVGGEVWTASCDIAAGRWARVRSVRDVRLEGGGGTDMRVGIEAAVRRRPRPQVVVVITDGYTPWPADPLGVYLVAVLVGSVHASVGTVPSWVTTVEVARDA